ncbi:3-dehydroquinate dehydratase I [hydrothermal vent metagenome]|uniref:3-dehydroquinate dehydratase n=1 Tax=hydrothermal vent metagenome TaxID=652676 RepID=A0A3B0VCJ2_9ZZZZ
MNSNQTLNRGMICVAVAARDAVEAEKAVRQVRGRVEVVEIRLDAMPVPQVPQVRRCCDLLEPPLIFTNRPLWEGGQFRGPETERLAPLLEAAAQGAAFIDFELRADPGLRGRLLASMAGSGSRLIISCHDFAGTPTDEELGGILQQMLASGAHIGKIVTMAHSDLDVLRVLHLQVMARERDFPLIAFCMGEAGGISRLATLYLGGFMTYAAISEEEATAPGQLSLARLSALVDNFEQAAALCR